MLTESQIRPIQRWTLKQQQGFTLIEAAITAVILMVGVIALIQIGRTTQNQITSLRREEGQPAIAERLIHEQVVALKARALVSPKPALAPIPPMGLEGVIYQVVVETPNPAPSPQPSGMTPYDISVRFGTPQPSPTGTSLLGPFKLGATDVPKVRVWVRE
jgi:Tfp pilus assembly protein PilE